jgi:solute carrier organic anion transporter family, member 4A
MPYDKGVITVPAGGGGTFLGGWLVKRWQLACSGIIKLCVAATAVAAAFTFSFVLTCDDYPFAGVTVNYNSPSVPGSVISCRFIIRLIFDRTAVR